MTKAEILGAIQDLRMKDSFGIESGELTANYSKDGCKYYRYDYPAVGEPEHTFIYKINDKRGYIDSISMKLYAENQNDYIEASFTCDDAMYVEVNEEGEEVEFDDGREYRDFELVSVNIYRNDNCIYGWNNTEGLDVLNRDFGLSITAKEDSANVFVSAFSETGTKLEKLKSIIRRDEKGNLCDCTSMEILSSVVLHRDLRDEDLVKTERSLGNNWYEEISSIEELNVYIDGRKVEKLINEIDNDEEVTVSDDVSKKGEIVPDDVDKEKETSESQNGTLEEIDPLKKYEDMMKKDLDNNN